MCKYQCPSRSCRILIAAAIAFAGPTGFAQPILFDFDAAAPQVSLPIDLSQPGINVHCAATGQGFSIQYANTMGFTPLGFGGCAIYPNSIYPSDLLITFDVPLSDFSIMYSPQELGCDDSATMRVTGYMNAAFVATTTTTVPNPGTWPTGTLALSAPQGFNNVVIHYEAKPPTCLDWGPIFMADNMVVTLLQVADPIYANGFD